MEWIEVATDKRGFVYQPSGRPFVPWGLNYDHDEQGRLLEDYWESEWQKVKEDFCEMKALGANVVRIHLQFGKFMHGPYEPDKQALDRLGRLIALAEESKLYLDLTGLGCYLKEDVPQWYDSLSEHERWDAQSCFWAAIAERGSQSPAIFCYDLMNEPVVPGGSRKPGQWLGPPFAGKYHFVQFITLKQANRSRPEVARQWIRKLGTAIRKNDRRHLITVGLVPWSLERPGLTSGFVPKQIAPELDFLCIHLYPEKSKTGEALNTLKEFAVCKPVVVEEFFPLRCSVDELQQFVTQSSGIASGWIGFYWGKTLEECRQSGRFVEALMASWLELFLQGPPKTGQ